jgi:hypothetical protein
LAMELRANSAKLVRHLRHPHLDLVQHAYVLQSTANRRSKRLLRRILSRTVRLRRLEYVEPDRADAGGRC